ncbi:MAG: SusC/RagA family TonB-linked outer membrane protein [Prevotellaceae bacterium]|jgi:TonB-linked SusC/RagA family outer membrane protein|nr:SusC/RagA family TonB-linked outer membrane protein [Prevotellaceae bacterium]
MKEKLICLLLCALLLSVLPVWAALVSGVVTDEKGEVVPGVSVVVVGSNIGVITDATGRYAINVPDGTTRIVFTSLDYARLEKEVPPLGEALNVALKLRSYDVAEVVVTAMGITREKKALGYAVQEITSDALQKSANTDLVTALQGKVTGVDIMSSSGMPGASSKITIRGARSFTDNNTPLYVVDGLPITSTSDISTENSVSGSDYANRSLDLDPNDIESVSILKGQAASALYGMRASNGVVVITTKNGKGVGKGKVAVSVSSHVSFDVISTLPKFQAAFAQGGLNENGVPTYNPTSSRSWGPKIEELPNDPIYGGNTVNPNTDRDGMKTGYYYVPQRASAGLDPWAKPQAYDNAKKFFDTGVTWNNAVNVSKGLEAGYWSLSLGSSNATGIVPSTASNRYNGKLATELQLSERFSGGFTGNFVNTTVAKQTGANNGLLATIYGAPPSYDFKGIPSHIAGNPYSQNTYRTGFDGAYWAVKNNAFTEETQRFFGNAFIRYEQAFDNGSKLNVKYQLGIDAYATNYEDLWGYGHVDGQGSVDDYSITQKELNSLLTATYSWKITDDLTLDALYGNEFIEGKENFVETFGLNFNFSGWNHINNASAYQGNASVSRNRTFGNFGNAALAWKNQLYLNATIRNDVVSTMPAGSRMFTYPSVSLGWVFTELDVARNSVLTFGKVRASYAEVGQAGSYTDTYYRTPEYGGGFSSGIPIIYPIQGVTAYTLNLTVYDPKLKPQNTKSYEAGVDLMFFNGLLSATYTFSRQNVKDQIFSVPLAGSTGARALLTNGGSVHTNAHEATLSVKPIDKKNIKWDFAFNFTKIDNYVDALDEGVESIFLGGYVEPQVRAGIGDKFPVIYGVGYLRNSKGEIVVDINGLPQAGEEQVLGTVAPDFRLGFVTNFEIYKARLSAVFDWKQGGVIYSATPGLLDDYGVTQKSADFRQKDNFLFEKAAVKENPDGTYSPNDIPISGADAYYYFTTLSNISESMVVENSFIKMREVALSYPVWSKNTFSVTFSAFVRNVILWSTLEGMDPESTQGNTNMAGAFERFSLPGATSYGFGINIKF